MANRFKTHEKFVEDYNKKYPNITVISKYVSTNDDITLKCKTCENVWTKKTQYAYGCPKCENRRRRKTNTHDDYILKLADKNIVSIIPLEKYITALTNIKHKCLKCNYEWEIRPNNVLNGKGCPYCAGKAVISGINDLWTTDTNIARLLLNKEDGYKYSRMSNKKLDWACPECNNIIKQKDICHITLQGLSCPKCSDGNSIPNKFITNILDSIGIDFETEKTFIWSNNRRYDIYISSYNCIIEMHGGQHYNGGFHSLGGRNFSQEKENDLFKYNLAINNNIDNYIVINCKTSDFSWMKSEIVNSNLNSLMDLNVVNFEECYRQSLNSKIVLTSKLWNDGLSVATIMDKLHISRDTVRRYLKKSDSIGLCTYNTK